MVFVSTNRSKLENLDHIDETISDRIYCIIWKTGNIILKLASATDDEQHYKISGPYCKPDPGFIQVCYAF